MGQSQGDFIKYPRTPHLFGGKGTADDKFLSRAASLAMLQDRSLIIEEKIDGTNVGIHFDTSRNLILQCRGHLVTEGMHPQYDLFKQWANVKRSILEERLEDRYILFGEWVYAKHSIHYLGLDHYFFEFDIYDKTENLFLTLEQRLERIANSGILTVPILHRGKITQADLQDLIGPSRFDSRFENPVTKQVDRLMEGVYLRTEGTNSEACPTVTRRSKLVRPEFIEKVRQSDHWQYQAMIVNHLVMGIDIWQ